MDFRDKIKAWQEETGIGQEGLAEATGYSQSSISASLRGHTKAPGYQLMLAIARAMGCSLEWLVDDQQGGPMVKSGGKSGGGLTAEQGRILEACEEVDRLFGPGTAARRIYGEPAGMRVGPREGFTPPPAKKAGRAALGS